MKIKKPKFWDLKRLTFISIILYPLSLIVLFRSLFNFRSKLIFPNIKTICVGNIYVGGTGKTPLVIKINDLLNSLKFKTSFIKKYYSNQIDEQKMLKKRGILFCEKKRLLGIRKSVKKNIDVAILDDGLQDNTIKYDLTVVCFNIERWIGNGMLLPSGPLRERLNSLKKYNVIVLNGNGEKTKNIKSTIKKYAPEIKIFESKYTITNSKKFNKNKKYFIFSGIGNPQTFLKTLIKNNFNIVGSFEYPDHYQFKKTDLIEIRKTAKKLNSKILTTEKDFMRLTNKNSVNISYAKIKLEIKNEIQFVNLLKKI